MTKMITKIVPCEANLKMVNFLIKEWERCGWQLKGTPVNFKNGECWLVFETDSSLEMPDDISENVE